MLTFQQWPIISGVCISWNTLDVHGEFVLVLGTTEHSFDSVQVPVAEPHCSKCLWMPVSKGSSYCGLRSQWKSERDLQKCVQPWLLRAESWHMCFSILALPVCRNLLNHACLLGHESELFQTGYNLNRLTGRGCSFELWTRLMGFGALNNLPKVVQGVVCCAQYIRTSDFAEIIGHP